LFEEWLEKLQVNHYVKKEIRGYFNKEKIVKYMWIDLKKIRLTDSNIEKMDKDML
jgi:hypothetical protein